MATMTQAAPPTPSPAGAGERRSPADAAPPPPPPASNGNGQRRTWVLAAGIVVGLLVVAFGARAVWFATTHESTDDAQVDADITPISTRISGYVMEVRVQDNQPVKTGDTLVVLDGRDLRARVAQMQADLAALIATTGSRGRVGQAVAQLEQSRAAAAAATATVAQDEANAQKAASDLQRYQSLSARNIVSQQQLDAARAAAAATAAQLTAAQRNAVAAQEQVTASTAALAGSEARVAAARAVLDQAELQLSYTVVTAPADGVVSKKSVEIGQLVQAGQPLMSLVPLSDVWVTANFKETQIEDIRPGADAVIKADAYPDRTFHGNVESLSPATGARFSLLPPDNATGNFTKIVQRIPVRIRIDGQTDPAHLLRPGMSVDVTIRTK
jgi:membrane fusion protein, multidrug efflux system